MALPADERAPEALAEVPDSQSALRPELHPAADQIKSHLSDLYGQHADHRFMHQPVAGNDGRTVNLEGRAVVT